MNTLQLITHSGPVVFCVLLLLLGFSFLTWSILFFKWRALSQAISSNENFLDVFWSGKTVDALYQESKRHQKSPIAKIFQAGYVELQRLFEKDKNKKSEEDITDAGIPFVLPPDLAGANVERALERALRTEQLRLEKKLTFLATTGSTAPFIGLFGTVWGIMNSFQNIGLQGGASLAVVAPGIAEALIATAVGLLAAIPAVMGYNYFSQKVHALRVQMENFSGDFLNIVKRNFLTK